MGIRILNLRFVLGLDDPADTGLLWACIGPISNIFANLYVPDIYIEPNFMAEIFYIEGKGEIRVIPIERINISAHKVQQGIWLYGSKEIAALVIHTPYSLWALDLNGHELSVEKLTCDVPDLKELLFTIASKLF